MVHVSKIDKKNSQTNDILDMIDSIGFLVVYLQYPKKTPDVIDDFQF